MDRQVLTDLHESGRVSEIGITVTALDDFCAANGIRDMDFIKVDVGGHELDVLKGRRPHDCAEQNGHCAMGV